MLSNRTRYAAPILILAATAVLSARLLLLINQRAVNILFWDQWDFLTPLFAGQSGWGLFDWQHGIHRMGIGYFLIQALASWTHWNTRADSFAIFGLIFLAMLAALILKRALFGAFAWTDAAIPLIFLTATQYEIMIGTPDESAAAMPLLLLLLYCLSWLIRPVFWRYAAVLVVTFLLIFTGYGLLIAPVAMALLLVAVYQDLRGRSARQAGSSALALLLTAAAIALFLNGYHFVKDTDCIGFSLGILAKYPLFTAVMAAKFAGVDYSSSRLLAAAVGGIIVLSLLISLLLSAFRLVRGSFGTEKTSLAITVLTGYSLIFAASSAVGRTCLGIASAQASRYMTLLIPGFLGLYFAILGLRRPVHIRVGSSLLLIALLWGQLPYGNTDRRVIDFYSVQKENWKRCFLEAGDIARCNADTHFQIYPTISQGLEAKLGYLKQNNLSLYLDSPAQTEQP